METLVSGTKDILHFFITNFPSTKAFVIGGPAALAWSTACLMAAGLLKIRAHWKTGHTRKVFHCLIFCSVVAVQYVWKTPGVFLFGGMTTLTIGYALSRGSGHFMYEAIAREMDAPQQMHYIVIPYLATLGGGLFSNIFFPQTAVLGYLVAGLGDAVAEPVGIQFGRHQYRVPALYGIRAIRSLEGSAAMLGISALAMIAWLAFAPQFSLSRQSAGAVVLIAVISTLIEAVTPHGWDNATLQAVPAFLGTILL